MLPQLYFNSIFYRFSLQMKLRDNRKGTTVVPKTTTVHLICACNCNNIPLTFYITIKKKNVHCHSSVKINVDKKTMIKSRLCKTARQANFQQVQSFFGHV